MLCAIVQREAVNPRVGNLVHRVATVKFGALHKLAVIAKLPQNAFHFAVVRLRHMWVVFDVHCAERRTRRPNDPTLITLVVDGSENRISMEFSRVDHGKKDSKRCQWFTLMAHNMVIYDSLTDKPSGVLVLAEC